MAALNFDHQITLPIFLFAVVTAVITTPVTTTVIIVVVILNVIRVTAKNCHEPTMCLPSSQCSL